METSSWSCADRVIVVSTTKSGTHLIQEQMVALGEFRRHSHTIGSDELVQILKDCGLVDIRPTEIAGEYYDIFTAQRP